MNKGFLPNISKNRDHLNWFHFFISRIKINAEIMTRSSPEVIKTKGLLHNFLLIGKTIFQQSAININNAPTNINLAKCFKTFPFFLQKLSCKKTNNHIYNCRQCTQPSFRIKRNSFTVIQMTVAH